MNHALFRQVGVLAFSAILTLSILVSAHCLSVVSANGIPAPPINRVYISNDGTIDPSTASILRDGNIYTLTGNMPNTSLVVKRDNIVIDGAGYGIHGYSTSYYDGIIISYRTNITIKNMDISPFGQGVRMDYASNNTITGNKMQAFNGVSLLYSDYNQITGNDISDGYGVQGLGSNNLIIGNNFTSGLHGGGNGMGIYITGSNNTISQNFFQEELSIQLTSSSTHNTISNNTIVDGETGILLGKSSNNLVFGNIIRGKTDARCGALWISEGSTNNVVYGNQLEDNALAVSLGLQIADFVYNNVSNNHFYHNNFINNTQNVWVAPGTPFNFWDDGKQGNYWSGFHGTDSNGDGISETPYVITSNNKDRYPLMAPFDISTAAPSSASSNPSPSPSQSPSPEPDPTPAIPEFETWIILPLIMAGTLVSIAVHRRNRPPPSRCISCRQRKS
jgi:parallel beta-helix repeat protein